MVTVTSASLPDLTDLLCFLIAHTFTRIHLNVFRPIGRGKGHPELGADPTAVRAALRRAWLRCYPNRPLPPDPHAPPIRANCGVGAYLNIMPNDDVFPCPVLTGPEFRCGNVRAQPLSEVCRRQGLLGRLQALDFRELAGRDGRLTAVTPAPSCLGPIYAARKDSLVWRDTLMLLPGCSG